MALGGSTAPWLTIGFLLAVWATQRGAFRRAARLGVATVAVYLLAWLLAYHVTFAIRESVALTDAWREAAPWLLLAGPATVLLGVAAAGAHRHGVAGDVCLALPIAWSTPEIVAYVREGWSFAVVVGIPTAVLALMPLVAAGRREARPIRLVLAYCLLAMAGLALLPLTPHYVHSY